MVSPLKGLARLVDGFGSRVTLSILIILCYSPQRHVPRFHKGIQPVYNLIILQYNTYVKLKLSIYAMFDICRKKITLVELNNNNVINGKPVRTLL